MPDLAARIGALSGTGVAGLGFGVSPDADRATARFDVFGRFGRFFDEAPADAFFRAI